MSGGTGYYPDQPYYAPGWSAPAGPPPRRRRAGRRAIIAAVVVLVVLLLGTAVLGALRYLQTRPLGEVTGPVTAAVGRLDVGHCLAELPEDGPVGRVRVVPCADPHEAEVVGAQTLDDGAFPGADAVAEELAGRCRLPTAAREAGQRLVLWAPSAASWRTGDRRGLCLAWTGGGTVRGALEDSGSDVT